MKRTLLIAMAVLAAVGIGTASAYFTDQATVPDNVIQAGTVEISTEPTSAALSIPAIAPGGVESRNVRVVNTGMLGADVIVTGSKKAGYTALYEALTCVVKHGQTVLYDGTLDALRTSPLNLQPGAQADLTFELGLPATAGNDVAGDYVKLTLYFDAEQVRP